MPIYEYRCLDCKHEFDLLQKFSDPPLETCSVCSGTVKKLISRSAFHLKGDGWYVTDYARKSGDNGQVNDDNSVKSSDTSKDSDNSTSGDSSTSSDSSKSSDTSKSSDVKASTSSSNSSSKPAGTGSAVS